MLARLYLSRAVGQCPALWAVRIYRAGRAGKKGALVIVCRACGASRLDADAQGVAP
jgi:hypothetical protein